MNINETLTYDYEYNYTSIIHTMKKFMQILCRNKIFPQGVCQERLSSTLSDRELVLETENSFHEARSNSRVKYRGEVETERTGGVCRNRRPEAGEGAAIWEVMMPSNK